MHMLEVPSVSEAAVDVNAPDGSRHRVRLTVSPFLVGRGEEGNSLSIPDKRISRRCAAIVLEGSRHYLEDRGHHSGVFINKKKVSRQPLEDGDVITFGQEDSSTLYFVLRKATLRRFRIYSHEWGASPRP